MIDTWKWPVLGIEKFHDADPLEISIGPEDGIPAEGTPKLTVHPACGFVIVTFA
jgi:hypothetical protein